VVRFGVVSLSFHVAGRGNVEIERIPAGAMLGWSWLFAPYRWRLGAVAAEQVLAVEFEAAGVRRLMADDPELGRELYARFMPVVVDRLQAARRRLVDLYGYPT
jgi:CRP-like cAMP-binding protein